MPDILRKSKAQAVRDYILEHPEAEVHDVAKAVSKQGFKVDSRYVSQVKWRTKTPKAKKPQRKTAKLQRKTPGRRAKYPRHNLQRALRIPQAILEQNAGRECSEKESASFVGIKYTRGPYTLELSSAIKFRLLERPSSGRVKLTDIAKMILRPQEEGTRLKGLRKAILAAPEISEVYEHYRGENLPDEPFFANALVDKFGIPQDKVTEFKSIFIDSLQYAKLIEESNEKLRVIDVSGSTDVPVDTEARLKKLGKGISVTSEDTCFVVMPFAEPYG
ncbi:MAG: hypothetical protein ACFFCO_12645, partial [Promethearchaeota archaeon]